jgi:Fic family protein
VQLERFQNSPVGHLVPIQGHDARLGRDYRHFAFVPSPLPATVDLTQRTLKLLSEADRTVGALQAMTRLLPRPSLLVRPALTKEAVATSALEGTYAPFMDVLEADYVDVRKQSAEVREVRNYVRAAERGLRLIDELPICVRLASELQGILVDGTRGDEYDAGRVRQRQVCIGDRGLGIEQSRFVPPPPGSELDKGLSDWEKWINSEDDVPLLVKIAVGHYQFEALHPFSDGNGRIGRLLITLQLITARVLEFPILNLSPWLEPRREAYTDHLLRVSETGDFDPWVAFFAEAVKARAEAASETIGALLKMREDFVGRLRGAGARGVAVDLASDLVGYPLLAVSDVVNLYNVSYPTANSAVNRLVRLGLLHQITGGNYGRIFRCDPVFDVIQSS